MAYTRSDNLGIAVTEKSKLNKEPDVHGIYKASQGVSDGYETTIGSDPTLFDVETRSDRPSMIRAYVLSVGDERTG